MTVTGRLGAAFLAALFCASCEKQAAPPPPPPPGVVCVAAEQRDVANTYQYIGQAVAEDWVDVVARVEGFLVKQCFQEGSLVKKDDLLFEIDPRPFEAQVKQCQGDLDKALATLADALINFQRYSTLAKQNAVAQKTLDEATMQKGEAEGQVLSCQGQLDIAKINLGYTKIMAPFDGKIGTCPVSVGNLVGPTINTKLTRIVSVDPIKVEFSIPEATVVHLVKLCGSVSAVSGRVIPRVLLSNGDAYPLPGTIYFSDNEVDNTTGTLLIRVRFANPDRLLVPGAYVKVRLETKEKIAAILVPQIAIQRDQTGEFVFVVDADKKVQRRQVQTGQTHGLDIEIRDGIKVGDLVITQGLMKVRPGMVAAVTMAQPKSSSPGAGD